MKSINSIRSSQCPGENYNEIDAASKTHTSEVYFVEGLGIPEVSGHLRKRSARWSIGAVRSPTTVSYGGLSGVLGWEREGTNIFVRPKLLEQPSLSSWDRACSSLGKSSLSSSLICSERLSISSLIVGTNCVSDGVMFWNAFSCVFTYIHYITLEPW